MHTVVNTGHVHNQCIPITHLYIQSQVWFSDNTIQRTRYGLLHRGSDDYREPDAKSGEEDWKRRALMQSFLELTMVKVKNENKRPMNSLLVEWNGGNTASPPQSPDTVITHDIMPVLLVLLSAILELQCQWHSWVKLMVYVQAACLSFVFACHFLFISSYEIIAHCYDLETKGLRPSRLVNPENW